MAAAPRVLTYATRIRGGHEWQADVYGVPGRTQAPIAIVLPGETSTRATEAFRDLATALTGRGIVAIVADHWPAPGAQMMRDGGAGFREAVELVSCLVRSAGEITHCDIEQVILFGQSAGGVDGLYVALEQEKSLPAWDAYAPEVGQQIECLCGSQGVLRVDGFVGLNGGYEAPFAMRSLNPDLGTFMSAFTRIDRPARVLRFVVGTRDEVIPPPIQARHRELFLALEESGHDVGVATVDDTHVPSTGSPGWQASLDAIVELASAKP